MRSLLGTDLPFRPLSPPSHFYILPISAWLLTQYPCCKIHSQLSCLGSFDPSDLRLRQIVSLFVLPTACLSPLCFIIRSTEAAPTRLSLPLPRFPFIASRFCAHALGDGMERLEQSFVDGPKPRGAPALLSSPPLSLRWHRDAPWTLGTGSKKESTVYSLY